MEFNLVVPGIELVGTTVKTLTIGNNIVDVEKEASNGVQGVQTRLKRKDRFESK